MCYNCGCGMPDNDMGKGHAGVDPEGKSMTTKTIQAAAEAFDMDAKTVMQNMDELLHQEMNK